MSRIFFCKNHGVIVKEVLQQGDGIKETGHLTELQKIPKTSVYALGLVRGMELVSSYMVYSL